MNEEQINGIQFPEEEAISVREQRRRQLEKEYAPDEYRIIRKELFAHLRDPAITIRDGSISFNASCIKGLEGVIYIKLSISESRGRLTAECCDANDKNALRWCIAKDGSRKSRKMNCQPFTDLIFKTMGWDKNYRYKMLGYLITYEGKQLYVFDLNVPERFHIKQKESILVEEDGSTAETVPVDTRKGFFPEEVVNSFGPPVPEYNRQMMITEKDGFVSLGLLTGEQKLKEYSNPPQESVMTDEE